MSRILPIIAFFVISACALAPREAEASCGDWLAHPATATMNADSSDLPLPAHRPCNGPLCKQSPSGSVPSPSVPTTERSHEQLAPHLRGQSHAYLVWDGRAVADRSIFLPDGFESDIERPPQV